MAKSGMVSGSALSVSGLSKEVITVEVTTQRTSAREFPQRSVKSHSSSVDIIYDLFRGQEFFRKVAFIRVVTF